MAIAASNWTRSSVASLLTGKYPNKHLLINSGLSGNVNLFPDENMPAVLKSKSYRTISLNANWDYGQPIATGTAASFDVNRFDFLASGNISLLRYLPMFINMNYHETADKTGIKSIFWLTEYLFGFDSYWYNKVTSLLSYNTLPFYPPEYVFDSAAEILESLNGSNSGPVFLWAHLMVPHSPYLPGKPFQGAFSGGNDEFASYEMQDRFLSRAYSREEQPAIDKIRLRYDENLLYADNALGNFLGRLRKAGRLDDSIVIVSADHGESFGHGWQGHGGPHLYQPLVHIPLLIHLPGQKKGQRITTTVSQADIAPTILDLLGYSVPSWMNGRSLKAALEGGELAAIPVFTMNLDGNPIRGKISKINAGVYYGKYKYIGRGEFFDLHDDPDEQVNLVQQESDKALMMNSMLIDMLAR
jgi:arylsulfatase A-like enzyme